MFKKEKGNKMKTLLCALFLTPASLLAQPTIHWHSFDGGGGASAGGRYRVNGTAGQPDAGAAMTGGILSASGGFWVVPMPGAPRLSIERVTGGVRVSWPLAAGDGVLEQSDTLNGSPVPWTAAPYPYVTNGSRIFVTLPLPPGNPVAPAMNGEVIQIPAKKLIRFRKR